MRLRRLILALLCVLASLLVPGIAPAHSASGAENRVWAFDLAEQVHIAGPASLTPELHRGYELAEYDSASGSLLAAKGGLKSPGKNPAKAPKGFEWRGKPGSKPGSKEGNWHRIFPDGSQVPKK